MQRTFLQETLLTSGLAASVLGCLLTAMAAYTVGYFDGCEDSSPHGRKMVPFTAVDVAQAMSIAIRANPALPDDS